MILRLVVSLRMAVDASFVQVRDRDHFTVTESGTHEMMGSVGPSAPQTPFSPFSHRGSKRPIVRPNLLGPRSEAWELEVLPPQ